MSLLFSTEGEIHAARCAESLIVIQRTRRFMDARHVLHSVLT